MDNTLKTHAKDYLLKYKAKKNTPIWLALLIQKIIDTNAKVSNKEKEEIYQQLLKENWFDGENNSTKTHDSKIVNDTSLSYNSASKQLILQKINQVKGVNALIANQEIIFSKTCTVFYGLNGTGKSGYFRIIHELAGGEKIKNILWNIHKQNNNDLEVDVDYLLDSQPQTTYKWENKMNRGVAPFNKIKVFDSEYLPVFLNERESSVNIEPLGLMFFQVIASIIDDYKTKLSESMEQKQNESPDLQPLIDDIHSTELKALLQKTILTRAEQQQLDMNIIFSDENKVKLNQLNTNKGSLEKENTDDTIKVITQEKTDIDSLKGHLLNIKLNLEQLTDRISSTINTYCENKKIKDDRIKEFEILKNIPSKHTDEWQSFIKSAKEYGENINQSTLKKNEKCIYCHQTLDESALKIIQAYSEYLGDKSQLNYEITKEKLSSLKKKINELTIDFSFSEDLESILSSIKYSEDKNYLEIIEDITKEAKNQKEILKKALEDKNKISNNYILNLLKIDEKLIKASKEKENKMNDLQKSMSEKIKLISEHQKEITTLEDKQNLSKWNTKIKSYFSICSTSKKYDTVNQKINTSSITRLSSKAHDELLTESIRISLENELKALGKEINISLKKTSANKGLIRTKLKISGNDICSILSEGEQKSVGLALFLAEAENWTDNNPLVFDDPVTSVDHEVSHSLAKKLLWLSTKKQVIIFTHNKLFYDSLVYWTNKNWAHHLCKNYENGNQCKPGFHVYTYKIDRVAKDKTGRVLKYQNLSLQYYIDKAENEIETDYTLSNISGYLKSAIEYYIDENILNKQCLMRDKKIKDHIEWGMLKGINPDSNIIDQLQKYWEELSSRGTHLTANSQENSLSTEELSKIISFLKK